MRWHEVVPVALVARVEADSEVQSVLGIDPLVFMAGEREFQVPSLRWTPISTGLEDELFERTLVQLDFWVRSVAQAVTLSSALRRLLHHDVPITVGTLGLWSMLVEPRAVRGMRDGIWEGSLDFRFQYLRRRYTA
jgi:hypothetical protein